MRFDYLGMGDSGGDRINSDESLPDLDAAIDALIGITGVREIVHWGLCDAAPACLMCGYLDACAAMRASHEFIQDTITPDEYPGLLSLRCLFSLSSLFLS